MACITTGYSTTCDNQKAPGGITSIYIIDSQDIDTIDYTTTPGSVTSLTLDAGSGGWLEVVPKRQTAGYVETAQNIAPDTVWEQIMTMTFPKRSLALRNFLQTLSGCACGITIVWTEVTGERFISGFLPNQEFLMNGNEGNSGVVLTDPNQETLSLRALSSEKAFILDASVTVP